MPVFHAVKKPFKLLGFLPCFLIHSNGFFFLFSILNFLLYLNPRWPGHCNRWVFFFWLCVCTRLLLIMLLILLQPNGTYRWYANLAVLASPCSRVILVHIKDRSMIRCFSISFLSSVWNSNNNNKTSDQLLLLEMNVTGARSCLQYSESVSEWMRHQWAPAACSLLRMGSHCVNELRVILGKSRSSFYFCFLNCITYLVVTHLCYRNFFYVFRVSHVHI